MTLSIRCFFGRHKFTIKTGSYVAMNEKVSYSPNHPEKTFKVRHQCVCERCGKIFMLSRISQYHYNYTNPDRRYKVVDFFHRDEYGYYVVLNNKIRGYREIDSRYPPLKWKAVIFDKKKKPTYLNSSNSESEYRQLKKIVDSLDKAMKEYNETSSIKLLTDKLATTISNGGLSIYDQR